MWKFSKFTGDQNEKVHVMLRSWSIGFNSNCEYQKVNLANIRKTRFSMHFIMIYVILRTL